MRVVDLNAYDQVIASLNDGGRGTRPLADMFDAKTGVRRLPELMMLLRGP